MKKKVTLFALVFALILTCASAMAANIKDASAQSGSGATIEKTDNQSVKVTYDGEKDKEYVVMAVAQSGIDSTAGRPTVDTIGTNEAGVVVYMDQAKGNSNGKVEFTVRPNLDKATKDDVYSIYISSNAATNSAMTKVGSFTIEELLAMFGDVNGDGQIKRNDRIILTHYIAEKNNPDSEYGPGKRFNVVLDNADVNADGDVKRNDRIILTRYLAGMEGYETLPYSTNN